MKEKKSESSILEQILPDDEKLALKIEYSQPAINVSLDTIKQKAKKVISEAPLEVEEMRRSDSGEEEQWKVSYDTNGRVVSASGPHFSYTREYDLSGYIRKGTVRERDKENPSEWIEEELIFSYGHQEGKVSLQRINVSPYQVTDNIRGKQIHPSFVVDLSSLPARLPHKFTPKNSLYKS
ncbi:hypothetical protein BH09PAT1_BH09PAT1_0480 [soil metagenome]